MTNLANTVTKKDIFLNELRSKLPSVFFKVITHSGGLFIGYSIILLASTISVLLKAWVFAILWAWYVVPIFNLPMLSLPAAAGLVVFLYALNLIGHPTLSEKQTQRCVIRALGEMGLHHGEYRKVYYSILENDQSFVRTFTNMVYPLVLLAVGWILKQDFLTNFFVKNDVLSWFVQL
jgi:hypothetical protein